MSRSVVFTPEVDDQLVERYRYILPRVRRKSRGATRRRSSLTARNWLRSRLAAVPATTSGQDSARSASGDESLLPSLYWITPWRSSASSTVGAITRRY